MSGSPILVLGGAECVWDDIDALEAMMGIPWPGPVIVVNDMGYKRGHNGRRWEGRVDHWATLHAEKLAAWKAQRQAACLDMNLTTWSSVRRNVVDQHWKGVTGGSSGLYAVDVALRPLKYPRAVCCGIPMDASPNTFSARDWTSHKRYRRGWERELEYLRPRVRSMSGWTRSLLGQPTVRWIGLAYN